tara:strand:+ start:310 stop:714 length:405 start_codon:yes stop_codon:yes gene_type:complete
MSTTNNTSVRVTRGDRLLRMVKKSKKFVKPKPLALKRSLRLQTKSPKRKPSSAPKNNNFASVNNIAKTIQALENLKTPASKSKKNNNAFQFLNFGRDGAPVVMSQRTSSTERRVSSRERKAPKRYGFNNNKSKP